MNSNGQKEREEVVNNWKNYLSVYRGAVIRDLQGNFDHKFEWS